MEKKQCPSAESGRCIADLSADLGPTKLTDRLRYKDYAECGRVLTVADLKTKLEFYSDVKIQ